MNTLPNDIVYEIALRLTGKQSIFGIKQLWI